MQVLIVGGGIAGSVAAMAIHQAGITARVAEAYPPPNIEVGSYFNIAPNGLRALEAVDALHLAQAAGFPTRHNVMWSDSGHRLGSVPLGRPLADGTLAQTLKRSHLTSLLTDEVVRRGIRVDFGRRLIGADLTADGRVEAWFDDGSQVDADVLVGADGVHSTVRKLIDPAAPSGRYVGLTNFGGITTGVRLAAEPETWHLVFGRRAFFGYHLTPQGEVVWFANVPRERIGPDEARSTTREQWQAQLVDLFADDRSPAAALVSDGTLELVADNTHDLAHVPQWRKGPMVIIGDAAHAPTPASGQGASMASEDAVVIAQALRDVPSVEGALATYERLRRERVENVVALGARGSSGKAPGRLGRLMRDVMLPLVFRYGVTEKSLAWLYDYRVDWYVPIELVSE